jgi:thymidine kinase
MLVPRLLVIFGPMCSSKSATLLRVSKEALVSGRRIFPIASSVDGRGAIVARNGESLDAAAVLPCLDAVETGSAAAGGAGDGDGDGTIFVVDEAQFFEGNSLLRLWQRIAPTRASLFAAGLDLDYRRKPFGAVLALADVARAMPQGGRAVHLCARCCHRPHAAAPPCGRPAPYSQRLTEGGSGLVKVGGAQFYRPACALHHEIEPADGSLWATEA